MSKLFLHCGAEEATLDQVRNIPVPEETQTYKPVSHFDLIQNIVRVGDKLLTGHEFHHGQYGMTKGGGRFFGIHTYQTPGHDDKGLAIGFRNSYDKKMKVGLTIGAQVFVCDNLALSGAISYFRKHTGDVHKDLYQELLMMVDKSADNFTKIADDLAELKEVNMDDDRAWELLGFLEGRGILSGRNKKTAIGDWREPRHEEFAPRNAYSFYNCVNEGLKNTPMDKIMSIHTKMHDAVMERACGRKLGEDAAADTLRQRIGVRQEEAVVAG